MWYKGSEIYSCDYLMSFMKRDGLTLDLEQYFKIYLFISMCDNITILAFKD